MSGVFSTFLFSTSLVEVSELDSAELDSAGRDGLATGVFSGVGLSFAGEVVCSTFFLIGFFSADFVTIGVFSADRFSVASFSAADGCFVDVGFFTSGSAGVAVAATFKACANCSTLAKRALGSVASAAAKTRHNGSPVAPCSTADVSSKGNPARDSSAKAGRPNRSSNPKHPIAKMSSATVSSWLFEPAKRSGDQDDWQSGDDSSHVSRLDFPSLPTTLCIDANGSRNKVH